MFTSTFDNPYPVIYMKRFYSTDPDRDWAQKANNWAPQNFLKWSDPNFNKLYEQAKVELDPEKNRQLWMQMNDVVVNSFVDVPLIDRKYAEGKSKALNGPAPSPFDCSFAWNVADWTKG